MEGVIGVWRAHIGQGTLRGQAIVIKPVIAIGGVLEPSLQRAQVLEVEAQWGRGWG